MPSNNVKYSEEMREQTAAFIIKTGKSATRAAHELGIGKNTICRWVRDYRRKHKLLECEEKKVLRINVPSYSKDFSKEWKEKLKEKEREIKKLRTIIEEEKEKVEILKKFQHIFMQQPE